MKIKFSNLVDFIEELEKDKDKIERGIVRVNFERVDLTFSPNICHVFIRAECIINRNIIELREFCGDLWGIGSASDDDTKKNYSNKKVNLEEGLHRLGITDIRGGTIEETEASA
jgi:hypothetical protein